MTFCSSTMSLSMLVTRNLEGRTMQQTGTCICLPDFYMLNFMESRDIFSVLQYKNKQMSKFLVHINDHNQTVLLFATGMDKISTTFNVVLIYSHIYLWQWAKHKAFIRHVFLCTGFEFLTVSLHDLFFPFCSFWAFNYFHCLISHSFKKKNFFFLWISLKLNLVPIILHWNSSVSTIPLLSYVACNAHGCPEMFLLRILLSLNFVSLIYAVFIHCIL